MVKKISLWKNKLTPPVSYLGGKRREIQRIKDHQPEEFTKLIDVFGGGFSIGLWYIQESPKLKTHYNDINEDITNLYKLLKDGTDVKKVLDEFKKIDLNDEELYYKVSNGEVEIDNNVKYIYLKATSRMGDISRKLFNKRKNKDGSYTNESRNLKSYEKFYKYKDIMKNVEITCKDYKEILDQYKNDKDAFLYLDPPYISKSTTEYGLEFKADNIQYINDFMRDKDTKCKIMLNVDFLGYNYDLFKDMIRDYYSVKYASSTSRAINVYQKYHCIICNYEKLK